MERQLPEIEIEGIQYQFDINQMALLEKERPEWRLLLEDMKDCGTHYEFVYDKNSKRIDQSKTTNGISPSDIVKQIFTLSKYLEFPKWIHWVYVKSTTAHLMISAKRPTLK